MLKVGLREKKQTDRKKERQKANSIARIRARASRPAVSFACLKLHHAAKLQENKIQDSFDI